MLAYSRAWLFRRKALPDVLNSEIGCAVQICAKASLLYELGLMATAMGFHSTVFY